MSRAHLLSHPQVCVKILPTFVTIAACVLGGLALEGPALLGGIPSCTAVESSSGTAPGRQSPNGLLHLYVAAHETQDINLYKLILHDLFQFELIVGGAGVTDVPLERVCFARGKAVRVTRDMFADPRVGDIEISLFPVDDWSPCREVCRIPGGTARVFHGLRITLDPAIYIQVLEPAGEPWVFGLHHTWLHVTVVPDEDVPGSWLILRIREELEPL